MKHKATHEDPVPPLEPPEGHALLRRRLEAHLRRRQARHERDHETAWFSFQMLVLRAGLRCVGLYRRGLRNAQDLRLREETWAVAGLPHALDGLRLLHLSDLHFGQTMPEHEDAVCRVLHGVSADVCVVTGDLRFGYFGPSDHVAPAVRRMLGELRLRCGAYAVLGNHDTLDIAEMVEAAGLRVLINEGAAVEVNGAPLWIAGIDDPHHFRLDDLDAALRGAPDGAFRMLLAHTPERADDAAKKGVGLYLCGHTHGGQVRLPGLGAIKTTARCPRRRVLGHWQVGAMMGFTSPGLGTTDAPVRFGCPPEAVLFTLRRG